MVGGAYLRDKNTSARTSTENVGGAYTRKGAYMRDTMVYEFKQTHNHVQSGKQ